ncbi:MAG: acyloxyacyl hydrolase [Pyrinomonadaceae bacterium]|nr:acyloxyacyl hydrolase [Pyrinomonadaceae bacterium]
MKKTILLILLLKSLTVLTLAQGSAEVAKNEFTLWGGISPDSSTFIRGTGKTPDVHFGIIGFRYSRRFDNNNFFNLKYTSDVIPFAVMNFPDIGLNKRSTRKAYGVAPLGLQINFRPHKKYQPFVGSSGGFLFFDKTTPSVVGAKLGFTADLGFGLEIKQKGKPSFTIGYKYYHISNGGRGIQNPGFDNNLFYFGYTFSKKAL